MGRVVVLGSLNVDLVTSVERHPRPGETVPGEALRSLSGGKGANQAVAAARAGAEVALVGCVGDDADAAAYLFRLQEKGIDVSAVRSVAGQRTGHALIAVDEAGENTIIVIPGANGCLAESEVVAAGQVAAGDVLLVQLEVPLPVVCAAVRRAAGRGARVIINAAPYAGLPLDVVALANPLIANEHEAAALAESGAAPQSLLVTYGAHGVSWDGRATAADAVPSSEVVDTTGAGDAFCGALAASLALGCTDAQALTAALAAGAKAVRHAGAQPDPVM